MIKIYLRAINLCRWVNGIAHTWYEKSVTEIIHQKRGDKIETQILQKRYNSWARNTIISLCADASSDNIMQSFYDSLKVFYYAKFTSTLSLVD